MNDFIPNRAGFDALEVGRQVEELLSKAADGVRDRASENARVISSQLSSALARGDVSVDSGGAYVDVGYDKANPGFVLWWHEVGTVDFPATPHLRPALRQRGDL